jgi:hypothetical protein
VLLVLSVGTFDLKGVTVVVLSGMTLCAFDLKGVTVVVLSGMTFCAFDLKGVTAVAVLLLMAAWVFDLKGVTVDASIVTGLGEAGGVDRGTLGANSTAWLTIVWTVGVDA